MTTATITDAVAPLTSRCRPKPALRDVHRRIVAALHRNADVDARKEWEVLVAERRSDCSPVGS